MEISILMRRREALLVGFFSGFLQMARFPLPDDKDNTLLLPPVLEKRTSVDLRKRAI